VSKLPRSFRKQNVRERNRLLGELLELSSTERRALIEDPELLDLADVMVESAVGFMPLPLGVATGFRIDGRSVDIPMATEEPSVIAAAGYAGTIIARAGGFTTWADEPRMSAQVFLEQVPPEREAALRAAEPQVAEAVAPLLDSMRRRGGGFRGLRVRRVASGPAARRGVVCVELEIDVRDAMGANVLNSAAEAAAPVIERAAGARSVIAILTNAARERKAGASFRVPLSRLRRGKLGGAELAERIVVANEIALSDPERAVTHNKGIMNGITALALATANDTRALEAAVHAYAARDGAYRALTEYRIEGDAVVGELAAPLAFGTVGGATAFHPAARAALRLLGDPGATELARIAAALGLAQNFAAVLALVSEGIQAGHMRLHANRLAYNAGARGEEIARVAERVVELGSFNAETAARELSAIRSSR